MSDALALLAQNGIGEFPTDEVRERAWVHSAHAARHGHPGEPCRDRSACYPGDAVRITWHGDDSSRLFIDSGTMWVSPAIAGLITEPMSVEYNTTDITVEVVAPFESNRNRGA